MNNELPAGWAWATLGSLGIEAKGQITPRSGTTYDLYSVPAFPTRRPERIDGSEIKSGKREVQPGDVLLCKINPRINRVWLVSDSEGLPQIASTEYLVLRPHERSMGPFIQQFLSSPGFRAWIKLSVEGATGSHTRAKSGPVLQQMVSVAPLAEQERIVVAIAEYFSRLDIAEAALEAARSKLQDFRRSVLAAAFSGRLTNPTHTIDTDPGQLPGSWRWTTLHDVLEHTIGGVWGQPMDEDEVNVRVLRVTEFGKHTVLEPETGVVRAVSAKQLASRQLELGDILLEKSGGGPNQPVGRVVAFRTDLAEPAVPTNFVQLLRPSQDAIDPAFLTWTLDWWHKNGTAEAHQRATTNIRNLQTKAYLTQPVAVPPRAEQEHVVATIEEHFSVLNAAETALNAVRAKVSAFRRSVLAEAFAGRLVPQDPDDEPAAALLARIAGERPVRPTTRKRSK